MFAVIAGKLTKKANNNLIVECGDNVIVIEKAEKDLTKKEKDKIK